MGMIDRFLGVSQGVTALGSAATGMAEVFTQNATRKMELDEQAYAHAITQLGREFEVARPGLFDGVVNGLNRLPRPLLAMGTMALFVYAMVEPVGFGLRMEGLQQVPEPLWWLLGAIVGFYFGAREAHYFRHRVWPARKVSVEAGGADTKALAGPARPDDDFADNAALRDWSASLRE
ncbi:holin family protein [Paracoccus salsus]|uniref:holin family protein n=1 Tax=Paracoccus salsus TaxID=2911061 RepID=UPI001F448E85|nr:holin family protein [Paracoccus salsus]MCF3974586.1 holin family protein [Paracoccus salsus]